MFRQRVAKYFLHVVFPIMLGSAIYFFFRDKQEIIFGFFQFLSVAPKINFAPDWIKYNLPDALWFYAFLSTLIFIWQRKISVQSIIWLIAAISMGFLSEAFQFFSVIPGTFDLKDLLAYTISALACSFHFQNKFKYLFIA